MTQNVVSTGLVEWSLVAIVGNTMPPRTKTRTSPTNRRSCANQTTSSRPGVRQLNKSAIGFRAGKYTVRRWQQVGT
jgi:hypothetical protein